MSGILEQKQAEMRKRWEIKKREARSKKRVSKKRKRRSCPTCGGVPQPRKQFCLECDPDIDSAIKFVSRIFVK